VKRLLRFLTIAFGTLWIEQQTPQGYIASWLVEGTTTRLRRVYARTWFQALSHALQIIWRNS
jgi:hypothetical protein